MPLCMFHLDHCSTTCPRGGRGDIRADTEDIPQVDTIVMLEVYNIYVGGLVLSF